jgi:uncharacterized protein (TIGR00730 family)
VVFHYTEMSTIKRVCIFCGSSPGNDPIYAQEARAIGRILAERNIGVVYGGGDAGLMGCVAHSALEAGGEVIGIIPTKLKARERVTLEVTKLHEVQTMHERKALMEQLSDAIITLPGGIGTLDEFCEIMSWNQLGYINKPMGVLNVNGYYDDFLNMIDNIVEKGFFQREERDRLIIETSPEGLVHKIVQATATGLA